MESTSIGCGLGSIRINQPITRPNIPEYSPDSMPGLFYFRPET